MKRKSAQPSEGGLPLETLEQVVATLNPETEPGELAAQMVCVLAAPGRLEGARLWRVVGGVPSVWQESGELPKPDAARIEQNSARQGFGSERRRLHMGAGTRRQIRWEFLKRGRKGRSIRARADGWSFSGVMRKWRWRAASGAMR